MHCNFSVDHNSFESPPCPSGAQNIKALMSGLAGALLGLALCGTVAAGVDEEEVSAGCSGTFLLLCLFIRGNSKDAFITTWVAFPLFITLFVGVLVGGGSTFFLAGSIVLFLSTVLLYVLPQPKA